MKNSKKLKNIKSAIDENLANRHHGSKKDFCQEGENLETGASCTSCFILQRTSWLFMQLLSCFFRFLSLVLLRSCIHGLHLDRNSGAAPYRVIGIVTRHLS